MKESVVHKRQFGALPVLEPLHQVQSPETKKPKIEDKYSLIKDALGAQEKITSADDICTLAWETRALISEMAKKVKQNTSSREEAGKIQFALDLLHPL